MMMVRNSIKEDSMSTEGILLRIFWIVDEQLAGRGVPGWRISEGTIDLTRNLWEHAPGQGEQSIDLVGSPGAATIHQTFFTERGKRYVISGDVAHNPGIPGSRAGVYVNGDFFGILGHAA